MAARVRPLSQAVFAVAGAFIGFLLAVGDAGKLAGALYDELRPVVVMRGVLLERRPGEVLVEIAGEKLRPCRYNAMHAYAVRGGVRSDASIAREDRPVDGHTKPPGKYNIGIWRVWPVAGAERVVVYVSHTCDGRLVATNVAEIDL